MRKLYALLAICLFSPALHLDAASPLQISEFLASNTRGLRDDFNDTSDWIEIRNHSAGVVNLLDWCLTDEPGNLTKWRFPATNLNAGAYLVVYASGRDRRVPGAALHANFILSAGGEYLALVEPNGTNIATEFAPVFPAQVPNVSFGFGLVTSTLSLVTTNSTGKVRIPANGNDGTAWATNGYDDSAWTPATNGVGFGATEVSAFVATDVGPAMSNVNASAYLRIPFMVTEPTNISLLTLRMRYDDGFVVSINGMTVAAANAPVIVTNDSAATASHAAGTVSVIPIGVAGGLLRAGMNILAIQGLNTAAGDVDFLIVAELNGTTVPSGSSLPTYFTAPTPGAVNSGGSSTPGPIISDVTHTPNVPLDDQDLVVTARLAPSLNPVGNVTLFYAIMFGADTPVPMFDDGGHGDGAMGDGVYGATIPAAASTNGQMIRYYLRALDSQSNTSRWPQFIDPANSAQYLGTIVNPTNVISKLPIMHLFAPTTVLNPGPTTAQVGADSQAGGRVSFFYDGEFYDNVAMNLRGNSTAGFNKKSHRLEFNREHELKHPGPGGRIRKTSFTADYPDPTYLRQRLSFWLCDQLGAPAPFYYPVRLQLNGVFYQLANHNDVHGEEYLSRIGWDPNGALYNAAGQVVEPPASTGGFEKKTRKWDMLPAPNTNRGPDYVTMATGIATTVNAAQRRTNIFDMFDLPEMMNYLVAARWVHENDDVWANMSLYHDNDGDDLWRIAPFDLNLSWGAIFAEGSVDLYNGVQSTNDTHKAHPLYGSSQTLALSGPGGAYNRIYDVIFAVPQTREMFLRRMRTMLDTYIKLPGTPTNALPVEPMILRWRDDIAEEAQRDRTKWGWPPRGGQSSFLPGTNPITDITNAVNLLLTEFIDRRRVHFYGKHSITNTALPVGISKTQNAGIPGPQPPSPSINIATVEFNPSSGNQLHEYICVTNLNPIALDLSGWRLDGGVNFTFHPGTVIPGNSVLYVSPDVRAFKARTLAPRGGMGLFVVGPYQGQLSARGESLTLTDIRGRLVDTKGYPGSPSLAQQFLRVSELMYNPSPLAGSTNDSQAFEFIELKNISSDTMLNLTGVRFINGIDFNFTGSAITTLAPGARVLVVRSVTAFTERYGGGRPVAGAFAGQLDNKGERLQLVDATGEEILDFSYNNTWYLVTDGLGFSLVTADEAAEPDAWGRKSNWRPSGTLDGGPGLTDPPPPVFAPIVVTEILTHSDPPARDTVELCNPTTNDVNLGGWFLSDDFLAPKKYRITNGCIIPAGGYLAFDETLLTNAATALIPFAFSGSGDEVWLFSGDAGSNLTGYVSGENYGAAANGVSFGRHTNSVGQVHFVAQTSNTLGAPNTGPRVGPVVTSEIMYHPPDLADGTDNSQDEYLELSNITGAAVSLFNPGSPSDTWRLRGGIDFVFPPNQTLAANGSVLLVNFDATDLAKLAAFRGRFGVSPSVPVYGPYSGKLGNDADDLKLERPDDPNTNGVPYILVDRVQYEDRDGWPVAADGAGASLQRRDVAAYGNDPGNWTAAVSSAGAGVSAGAPPVIVTQPASQTAFATLATTFSVTADGSAPLRYQWRFNGGSLPGATSSMLTLAYIDVTQGGRYSVAVYNQAGSVVSAEATLTVIVPAAFFIHPQSVTMRGSSNVLDFGFTTNSATFTTLAVGTGPVSYQWRFNSNNIPGATTATLVVSNVGLAQDGFYDVLATDDVGTIPSLPARLAILVNPVISQGLIAQTVPVGSQVTLSVAVVGSPNPFTYEWRRGSTTLQINIVNRPYDFFTFTATNVPQTTQYRVVVKNLANTAPGVASPFANVITVADSDNDGLPDTLETALGLNPNDGSDALGDLDLDRVRNRDEYIAGTDLNDASSYLRIDLTAPPGMATVEFAAVSNRTYSVQYSDVLPNPEIWGKLADVTARTTNRVESFPDPTWTTNRFYRVILPLQP